MNLNSPKVSVLVITYNHERYIRQALDSILMQKVDFDYKIVIGEDCSQDGTRKILMEYKEKHSDKIVLILHEENVGMHENLNSALRQCTGEYIANCEGDDYWIDPHKLQKQVDFLEKHPQYIGAAHKIKVVDEHGNLNNAIKFSFYCQDEIYTIKHAEKGILPSQTATMVYRNILVNNPLEMDIIENYEINGDVKLALYLALNGNIYCFNEVMSHYRRVTEHGDSWSARNKDKNLALVYFKQYKELTLLAQQLKDIEIDYTEAYLNCSAGAFGCFLKKPNRENFEILNEIYTNYDDKIAMSIYILKKCIKWPFKKLKSIFQN